MDLIQTLMYNQVQNAGDNIAIEYGDLMVNYNQLNQSANQIANFLGEHGVVKGTLIGILHNRGPDLITNILGSLKVGAVFIPLDPHFPERRLEVMIEKASPDWFIAEPKHLEKLNKIAKNLAKKVNVIISQVDLVGNEYEKLNILQIPKTTSTSEPKIITELTDPCYIFFTSGSTGQPKAILGCYKGLSHFINWEIETFGIGVSDRVSNFTTPSFDAILRDIFVPLASGATICIPKEQEIILDAKRLVDWIDEKQITLVHCVPSLYKRILAEVKDEKLFTSLRYILMAGERIQVSDVSKWFNLFGERIKLVNLYGSSEMTMTKVYHVIKKEDCERKTIPAGKPMKGAKVIIFDRDMNICPSGVEGEIYIRSPYMTLGYYKEPEKTEEVFKQNPFNKKPDLLYKTGDKGKILHDGNLEFIGRFDHQVKIRGNRVEIGEIEIVLSNYPEVKEVAVNVSKDQFAEIYPVAYLVCDKDSNNDTFTVHNLREYLALHLPEYMIPGAFIILDKMPLTPTGKIDRKALPAPESQTMELGVNYVAPRNQTEEKVAEIFGKVLNRGQVGIYDNFFESGGHSLSAIRVITRIYQTMKIQISLKTVFEKPTVAAIAQEILNASKTEYHKIEPQPKQDKYLASHGQKRLWILSQMNEKLSSAYNLSSTFIIEGDLNTQAFNHAFLNISKRHEILRTYFTMLRTDSGADELYQIVAEDSNFQVDYYEVGSFADEKAIGDYINSEVAKPFDLSKPGLFRANLTKLGDQKFLFVFTIHHIISDAWSMNLMIGEVCNLYNSLVNEGKSNLPALKIQYRDYSIWQRKMLTDGSIAKQGENCREKMGGELPVLELPTDFPRPAHQSFSGDHSHFIIDNQLLHQLKTLATQTKTTLFTVLFTAYNTLLYRYSGQKEFIVGVPVHGRTDSDLEELIGFFVNTLVIRTEVDSQDGFAKMLSNVQGNVLEAFENQDYPFDKMVEELAIQRDFSRSPLFDTMFILQNTPDVSETGIKMGNLAFRPFVSEKHLSRFDLTVNMVETDQGMAGTFEYCTDLFRAETIQRLGNHFIKLLESIVANPAKSVSSQEILSPREKEQLLIDFNDSHAKTTELKCLHQYIEDWAIKTPGKVALILNEKKLTYRELNLRADQLSNVLLKKGFKLETPVALIFESSFEMIIAMLGVLKAGGVYIPIAADYPQERINYILNDLSAPILVTQPNFQIKIPENFNGTVIALDEKQFVESEMNLTKEIKAVKPNNLAYIVYTSGSTGQPKGVMIEHQSIVNSLIWKINTYKYAEDDKIIQMLSFAFDGAQFEIWTALIAGISLVMVENESMQDISKIIDLIDKHKVNHFTSIPGFYQGMLTYLGDRKLTSMKTITLAGDKLTEKLVNEHVALQGQITLFNEYGPTETAVVATYEKVNLKGNLRAVAIGRPINNTKIYILDTNLQLVPIGVLGEIYISGAGLARGYFNRPDLSSEKFIDNPFNPAEKIYKSGDLGRYLSGGRIEFIGRTDHQLKIRGYRVEIGEIEERLLRYPGIKEVVIDKKEENNYIKLVGYIVLDVEEVNINDVKKCLRMSLPEYMIPDKLITLRSLPLTPNGKIDRKALPLIENDEIDQSSFVEPSNEIQRTLAKIWSEVLGISKISINDNFFKIGGHSLTAIQMIARIHQELSLDCPIGLLFEAPTITELAVALESKTKVNYHQIRPRFVREYYPISHAQKRLWVLEQFESHGAYNIPSVWIIKGKLDEEVLNKALQTIVDRHEILRTYFAVVDGEIVQIVEDGFIFKVDYIEKVENHDEIMQLVSKEAIKPFDLTKPGLIRARLIKVNEVEYLFMFNMHHIISDGWSLNILMYEISRLYQAYLYDDDNPLPPLKIQYRDYSEWQNELLKSKEIKIQESYWLNQLVGKLPVLNLPTDFSRPPVQTFNGADMAFELDQETSRLLKQLALEQNATLFMILIAAYNLLLYRYTGQDDLIVGTPIAGRPHRDLEELIGFFVNTLVIRTKLSFEESFVELLQNIRKIALSGFANQDYPFDALVDKLAVERDLSRSPIFDTMFVLQNINNTQGIGEITQRLSDDLDIIPMKGSESVVSKFDLTLTMGEVDGKLIGRFNYNTDLFKSETILRMIDHFKELLRNITLNPKDQIGLIPIIDSEEKEQLLYRFNSSTTEYSNDLCIQQIFEEQAAMYPNRIAVISMDKELTYSKLNQRANRLARVLREKGVGPEVLVGIMLERSIDVAIGILGILKAGGAYLPIDPDYPTERINYLLDDSGVNVLLIETCLEAVTSEYSGDLIYLDEQQMSAKSGDNLELEYNPESLAYVIYTSGSTGQPKGVMIEHRNLLNEYYNCREYFDDSFIPVVLQVVSHSFDVFVADLCRSIYSGGTLVITSKEERVSPGAMYSLATKHRVNIITSTPALIMLFVDYLAQNDLKVDSLKWLFFGGEALNQEDYQRLQVFGEGKVSIVNCYGVTETTVDSTALVTISTQLESRTVPIGKPLNNVRVYIFDQALNPVPIGVVGEIYIAGQGVGRGYLNRPELTKEKFIVDLYNSNDEKMMMYRTGDLGRWSNDGNIEFCGRLDDQVKIRGYRIETGEIKASLLRHPVIKDAIVIDRFDHNGNKYLAAYLVTDEAVDISSEELQAYFKESLPDYMIPSSFMFLEELPLTPNGKVDHRALPEPDFAGIDYVKPRDQIEEQIAVIWSEVLGVAKIGVYDNFFNLGGNSLKMIELMMKMNKEFKTMYMLGHFMENPTIAMLAKGLSAENCDITTKCIIKLRDGSEEGLNLFCIHSGSGDVMVYQDLIGLIDKRYTVYGIQAKGLVTADELPVAMEELVRDYVGEVREILEDGPYYFLGHSMGGNIAYEMVRQLEQEGETDIELIMLDTLCYDEFEYLPSKEVQKKAMLLTDLKNYGLLPTYGIEERSVDEMICACVEEELKRLYQLRSNLIELVEIPSSKIQADIHYIKAKGSVRHLDQKVAWGKWTMGMVSYTEVGGNHYSMLDGGGELAREINKFLLKIRGINCE